MSEINAKWMIERAGQHGCSLGWLVPGGKDGDVSEAQAVGLRPVRPGFCELVWLATGEVVAVCWFDKAHAPTPWLVGYVRGGTLAVFYRCDGSLSVTKNDGVAPAREDLARIGSLQAISLSDLGK